MVIGLIKQLYQCSDRRAVLYRPSKYRTYIRQIFEFRNRHGTSREKLYQELGFVHLSDRRWSRRLCFFYKIINEQTANYLKKLLPPIISSSCYNLRHNKIFNILLQGLNGFNLRFLHIVFVNGINWILSSKTLFHSCPSNTHCHYLFAQRHRLFILYIILAD